MNEEWYSFCLDYFGLGNVSDILKLSIKVTPVTQILIMKNARGFNSFLTQVVAIFQQSKTYHSSSLNAGQTIYAYFSKFVTSLEY